jgi:elongation factor P--beta-lysine ligase
MNDVKEVQISGVKTPVIDATPAIPSRSWWAFLRFYDVDNLPKTKEELKMELLRVQINTSMQQRWAMLLARICVWLIFRTSGDNACGNWISEHG